MTTLDALLAVAAGVFCFLWLATAWLNHLLIETVEQQTEWVRKQSRELTAQAEACDDLTTQIVAASMQERIVSMWESEHLTQVWEQQ